jgi:hypothetical protein
VDKDRSRWKQVDKGKTRRNQADMEITGQNQVYNCRTRGTRLIKAEPSGIRYIYM